jgi:hypothetical protein
VVRERCAARRRSPIAACCSRSFGPLAPGTAGILLTDGAGNEGGWPGSRCSHAAARAPSATRWQLRRGLGVEIRTVRGGRCSALGRRSRRVTLADGQEIDAAVVVSGADPKTTLLG